MKAQGVYFLEPGKSEIREFDVPDPGPGEVQARCVANGICMGDVTAFSGAEQCQGYPFHAGHEGVAVVTKVGAGIGHIKEGDYVPSYKWTTVENLNAWGLTKFSHPPTDPSVALVEPVSCVTTALYSYNIVPGDRVLVLGAGFMGLLNVQGLHRCPVDELVVTDLRPHNLDLARKYGATEVIQAGTEEGDARLQELKCGQFDLVIECAGVESTIQDAGQFVRTGGRLAIFAWHHSPRALDLGTWHLRGITVLNSAPGIGTDHAVHHFDRALRLIERGVFDLTELISHRHPVNNVQEAMELAAERPRNYQKGVLLFN